MAVMAQTPHDQPRTPWWVRLLLLAMLLPFAWLAFASLKTAWFIVHHWQGRPHDYFHLTWSALIGALVTWYVAAAGRHIIRHGVW